MPEVEMHEVRRQKAPALPGRYRHAVVSQSIAGHMAEELQRQQQSTHCEQSRAMAAVAVESLQSDSNRQ